MSFNMYTGFPERYKYNTDDEYAEEIREALIETKRLLDVTFKICYKRDYAPKAVRPEWMPIRTKLQRLQKRGRRKLNFIRWKNETRFRDHRRLHKVNGKYVDLHELDREFSWNALAGQFALVVTSLALMNAGSIALLPLDCYTGGSERGGRYIEFQRARPHIGPVIEAPNIGPVVVIT